MAVDQPKSFSVPVCSSMLSGILSHVNSTPRVTAICEILPVILNQFIFVARLNDMFDNVCAKQLLMTILQKVLQLHASVQHHSETKEFMKNSLMNAVVELIRKRPEIVFAWKNEILEFLGIQFMQQAPVIYGALAYAVGEKLNEEFASSKAEQVQQSLRESTGSPISPDGTKLKRYFEVFESAVYEIVRQSSDDDRAVKFDEDYYLAIEMLLTTFAKVGSLNESFKRRVVICFNNLLQRVDRLDDDDQYRRFMGDLVEKLRKDYALPTVTHVVMNLGKEPEPEVMAALADLNSE